MSHFVLSCEHGFSVSQCRCPSREKDVRYEDAPCTRRHNPTWIGPAHPPKPYIPPEERETRSVED